MRYSATNLVLALCILAIGIALGVAGLYLGHLDDAPPLGLIGILLMLGAVVLSLRVARR